MLKAITGTWGGRGGMLGAATALLLVASAQAQTPAPAPAGQTAGASALPTPHPGGPSGPSAAAISGLHLGVASCSGSTCHGAVEPVTGSNVAQNEYLIWSLKDKHRLAYAALLGERGLRIAHNLGLPDAANQQICLTCHTDDVPPDQRGRQFQLSDGVGCEACHGAAVGWLGIHLSGAGHQANLAAGLYPTEQAMPRAEMCLSCHLGDSKRSITHQIMGAGHPPLPFELDTYTWIEPAHFVVDKDYLQRKGRVDDVRIWAIGQARDLVNRMNEILDPKNAPKGFSPELVLFDCQSCHHAMSQLQWQPGESAGLGPGRLKLYDADAVMLQVVAARVAPDAAKTLHDNVVALHRATTENWDAVRHGAEQILPAANAIVAALSRHDFSRDDIKAIAGGLISVTTSGEGAGYSGAQQATMALQSLVYAMKLLGYASDEQVKAMGQGLTGVFEVVANDQTYRPDSFVKALKDFEKTIPQ